MKHIILASTSPRRQELLENLGLFFSVVAPNFDENILNKSFSYELIESVSDKKGESILNKLKVPALVISADTVVVYNNIIFSRPKEET